MKQVAKRHITSEERQFNCDWSVSFCILPIGWHEILPIVLIIYYQIQNHFLTIRLKSKNCLRPPNPEEVDHPKTTLWVGRIFRQFSQVWLPKTFQRTEIVVCTVWHLFRLRGIEMFWECVGEQSSEFSRVELKKTFRPFLKTRTYSATERDITLRALPRELTRFLWQSHYFSVLKKHFFSSPSQVVCCCRFRTCSPFSSVSFFPKASLMLGFSFRFWNRAGAIRRRRICGRYGYHTTETILPRRICGRCCYHDGGDGSADAAVTMLFAAVGVEVLGSETTETDLRTLLLPCYLQLLGCRCWGARRRRRICGRCCYHAICSCWGAGAGERGGGDESADAAVTMLFAAVGVQVLGSETTETNLRTLVLLPCYLQLLGCRCWGARLPRRICGRCCYHAICSCWGAGAGERDGGDESADAAVTMLFAAVGVEVLGSETEETNLRTLLLPCYLQLLGWRCWGARLPRRICGRCCCHAICSCWGGGAGERDYRDESADAAVTMLFAAVGVQVLGSETEETNLRTLLLPCYLQLLGCRCHAICSCWGGGAGERDCGDESADGAVAMLFAAVGVEVLGSETAETNLRTVLLPCYLQLLGWRCWGARLRRRICGRCCCHAICSCCGGGAGERDCGDESADGVVAMLFAAVGVEVLGSETAETNLRTLLLPCYLQLLGCSCWGARRRRRICGRCCCHAICSCWGGGAGERDCGDEVADAAVTMLFAAVGVQLLGSETAEMKLRTLLLPCELGIGVGGDGAADGGGGGCCCLNKRSLRGPDFGPIIF